MDWNAVGAIGEIVGAIAVVTTLLYLSTQVREGNKQAELEGFRHTLDGFNEWMDQISPTSKRRSTTSSVTPGREKCGTPIGSDSHSWPTSSTGPSKKRGMARHSGDAF